MWVSPPWRRRRTRQTAPTNAESSNLVEITHPFHPFLGKRFELSSAKRYAGVDTLILRLPNGGVRAIPREWTDRKDPSRYEVLSTPPVHDVDHLLALAQLLVDLTAVSIGEFDTTRRNEKK